MGGIESEGRHSEPTSQQTKPDQAPAQGARQSTVVQSEQTQPPQGKAEGSESLQGPTTVDALESPRRSVFNCVTLEIRPSSLAEIRRWLRNEHLTEEEAQKLEKEWRHSLKTMNRQTLEETLRQSEERLQDKKESNKWGWLTAAGQALIPMQEEEVKVLREELRQRGG